MHPQLEIMKERFLALQPRERWLVGGGALLVLLVALYILVLAPLSGAVKVRGERVAQKQSDLAWMRSVAAQVSQLGPVAGPSVSNESMIVLIANSANQNGIGNALTGQTPVGTDGVQVRLENVNFDSMVLWIGRVQQQYGIRVDSANIDRATKAGEVNANLSFVRGAGAA